MGYLDPEYEKKHFKIIRQRLKRRGLEIHPDNLNEWEVHGPHQDMNYQVYVGVAYDPKDDTLYDVAIYPWATYEIESSMKWWDIRPENRIPVMTKGEVRY